jgi:hypothetical protein
MAAEQPTENGMQTDHPRSRAVRPVEATQPSNSPAAAKWPGETAAEHVRNALALLTSTPSDDAEWLNLFGEIEERLRAALVQLDAQNKDTREALQIMRTSKNTTDDLSRVESLLTVVVEGNRLTKFGRVLADRPVTSALRVAE